MDGIAVEAGLAGPGGVLLVVDVLLFLSQAQRAAPRLQRAGGQAAVLLAIRLPLPTDGDVCCYGGGIIILCSQGSGGSRLQNEILMRKFRSPPGRQTTG